jgi:uncharacterized Zn finger protein (UPF0148 family)
MTKKAIRDYWSVIVKLTCDCGKPLKIRSNEFTYCPICGAKWMIVQVEVKEFREMRNEA